MIKLSILVPTVPSRIELFYVKLMKELLRQIEPYKNEIELISLFDNKKRSIGKKRQDMTNLAQGEYIVFIDDDDRISEDYISQIMSKLYENPSTDCVVFDSICRVNGGIDKLCKYGIEFEYGDINDGLEWRGKPAHTMVYSANIVKNHQYTNMGHGEDYDWVKRACLDITNQTRIDKVLYYYDAEYATTSETVGLSDEIILENVNKKLNR
jgi:glycosyltransferase involved in cell wall biosynthesis